MPEYTVKWWDDEDGVSLESFINEGTADDSHRLHSVNLYVNKAVPSNVAACVVFERCAPAEPEARWFGTLEAAIGLARTEAVQRGQPHFIFEYKSPFTEEPRFEVYDQEPAMLPFRPLHRWTVSSSGQVYSQPGLFDGDDA